MRSPVLLVSHLKHFIIIGIEELAFLTSRSIGPSGIPYPMFWILCSLIVLIRRLFKMKKVEQQREKIRQIRQLLTFPDLPAEDRPGIKAQLRRSMLRLALLAFKKDLEGALNGVFDLRASRKLDAIQVLFEE
jgi:hypothetical protein